MPAAAIFCGAVERAVHVNQGRVGETSRGRPNEAKQHVLRAARAYAVYGAATSFREPEPASAGRAPFRGRAVKRAVHVDQGGSGPRTIGRAAKTMQHFLSAARRYAEHGPAALTLCIAAVESRAVKRTVHVDQRSSRVCPV